MNRRVFFRRHPNLRAHVVRCWRVALLFLALGLLATPLIAQDKRTLTYVDLMKFRQVQNASISKDGGWIAFAAVPDRGDGEVIVRSTDGAQRHVVPLGAAPVISGDGRWVALRLEPALEAKEKAKDDEDDGPQPGLALLATGSGEVVTWEKVRQFALSPDGGWLARLHFDGVGDGDGDGEGEEQEQEQQEGRKRENPGTLLVIRNLGTGEETEVEHVRSFAFDEEGKYLAYVVAAPDGMGDGLYLISLAQGGLPVIPLDTATFAHIETLTWWEEGARLAWVSAIEDEEGKPGPGSLLAWDGEDVRSAMAAADVPEGWTLPAKNRLRWTKDGDRLFFGYRPEPEGEREEPEKTPGPEGEEPGTEPDSAEVEEPFDPYDVEAILEGRGVDVWHTDDPLIVANQ
jgi:hypothetical protein